MKLLISVLTLTAFMQLSAADHLRIKRSLKSSKSTKPEMVVKSKKNEKKSEKKEKKSTKSTANKTGGCEDPLNAVLDILQCISEGDVACASAGYNTEEFKKIHNGKDTGTVIDGESYWSFVLSLVKLDFSYDHMVNTVGHNMASIRYIEKVLFTDGTVFGLPTSNKYPWSTQLEQHEHVLVTVDDECKIKTWNQYGDNAEQKAVDDVFDDIIKEVCILSPEICAVLLPKDTSRSMFVA